MQGLREIRRPRGCLLRNNDITAAGKQRRPHYERLLADMDAGRIDVVVATHTDRLHRHPMELEGYIDASERHHVQTHTTKGTQLDLNTSTGRMVARMLGAAARHEWERMVERQKDAKRRTREAGLHGGGSRPFGYDFDARDDRGSQIPGVSAGLAVHHQLRRRLRDQRGRRRPGRLRQAAQPGVNLTKIGDEWNAAGLRTPATARRGGGPWKSNAVRRVLLNGINAGLVVYQEPPRTGPRAKRGAYVIASKGKWEALVTPDTWRAAKAILTDATRRTGPGPAPRNLLTGVLICGVCGGRRFGVTRSTSSGRPAYTCRTWRYRDDATGRRHLSREADRLDAWVESIVIELLSRPDVVAALNTRPDVDIGALNARRAGINAELEEWARTPGITPRQLQIKNAPCSPASPRSTGRYPRACAVTRSRAGRVRERSRGDVGRAEGRREHRADARNRGADATGQAAARAQGQPEGLREAAGPQAVRLRRCEILPPDA